MEQKTTEAPKAPQGGEAQTTETPERAILREIVAALDLPEADSLDDYTQMKDTLTSRVYLLLGAVNQMLASEDMTHQVGLVTSIVAKHAPVTYKVRRAVKGGVL